MASALPDGDVPNVGPCCACEGIENVRHFLMLPHKAPIPGRGWGCAVCGLPDLRS